MTDHAELTRYYNEMVDAQTVANLATTEAQARIARRCAAFWRALWYGVIEEHGERVARELARAEWLEWEMSDDNT